MSDKGYFESEQGARLPDWLNDEQGRAFGESFGRVKDFAIDLMQQAVLSRYPTEARPDALPLIAATRMIYRAPPETDAAFAERLIRAPDIWEWAGTPTGIISVFEPYGFDALTCLVLSNYQIILDGLDEWYSRFILLCGPTYWEVDTKWDTPVDTWAEESDETWDSTATIRDLDYLRLSVRRMKSDDSYPVFIGVELIGGTSDGIWDSPTSGVWDVPGAVWSDTDDGIVYWPLGRIWGDEVYYGGPGTAVWTASTALWTDGLVPPSTGWPSNP